MNYRKTNKVLLFVSLVLALFVGLFSFTANISSAASTPEHVHNFTFEVSGSTITAICNNSDCDLNDSKISAALIQVDDLGTVKIDNQEAFEDAVGVEFDDFQYRVKGTSKWSNSLPVSSETDFQVRTGITVMPGDPSSYKEISLSYGIGDYTVTTEPSAKSSLVFNNSNQDLVSSGLLSLSTAGTFYYRLGTTGTWSTSIPTAKDAGEYTVYYYVKGNTINEGQANEKTFSGRGSENSPLGSTNITIAKYDLSANADYVSFEYSDTYTYNGNSQTPTISAVKVAFSSDMTLTLTTDYTVTPAQAQTNAGTYSDAKITGCGTNFTGTVTKDWKIAQALVEKPSEDSNKDNFVYTGSPLTYTLGNTTDKALYKVNGGTDLTLTKTNANKDGYELVISLNDKDNYAWKSSSGTNDGSDDLTYKFIIKPMRITVPAEDTTSFIYKKGEKKTYTIASDAHYKVEGNEKEEVGEYTVTVTLLDTSNTCWDESGDPTDPKTYDFVIKPSQIKIPTAKDVTYTYNGESISFQLENTDHQDFYTVSNDSQTEAGTYTVTAALKDKKNTCWEGEGVDTADKTFTFEIKVKEVVIPTAKDVTYTYSGSDQEFELENTTDSDFYTVTNDSRKLAGEQEVTVTLKNTSSSKWADGSTEPKTFTFKINKQQVEKPEADSTPFVFDATEQTYSLTEKADIYEITNNKRTKAGEQDVKVALKDKDNYEWADATTTDLTYKFTIAQYELNSDFLTIKSSGLVYNGADQTVEYEYSDPAFATIGIDVHFEIKSGSTGKDNGEYTLVLQAKDLENVKGEASKTWTIGKLTLTDSNTSIILGENPVYDSTEKTIAITSVVVTFSDGTTETLVETTSYTIKSGSTGTTVDTYTLVLSGAGNFTGDVSEDWKITKKQITKPTDSTLTYDKTEQTFMSDTDDYTVSNNKRTVVGEQNITATLVDTANTEWTDGTIEPLTLKGTINQYELNSEMLTFTSTLPFTYNTKSQTVEWKYEDSSFSTITLGTDYKVSLGESGTNAGKYNLTLVPLDTTNITGSAVKEWEISPFELTDSNTVITLGISPVYNATEQEMPITSIVVTLSEGVTETLVLTTSYTISGNKATHVDADTSTTGVQKHKMKVAGANNFKGEVEKEWEMTPKTLGITWDAVTTFAYNGNEQAPNVTLSGVETGDTVNVTISGKEKNANTYHQQTYTATASSIDNTDYKLPTTNLECKYSITQIIAKLKWSNLELSFNGQDQLPTCEIENLLDPTEIYKINLFVNGDHKNAGTYSAKAISIEGNENYRLPVEGDEGYDKISSEFKITPLKVAVFAEGYNVTQSVGDKSGTKYTKFDIILRSTKDYSDIKFYFMNEINVKTYLEYANISNVIKNKVAGDLYAVNVGALLPSDNYVIFNEGNDAIASGYEKEVMFEFFRAGLTLSGNTDYVYNGAEQLPVVVAKDEYGHEVEVVVTVGKKDVGNGYISVVTIKNAADKDLFAITPEGETVDEQVKGEFEWNITPATLTFEAKSTTPLVYNGKAQHPEIKINGLFGTDTTELLFANEGVVSGDYTLLITGVSNTNYVPAVNSSVAYKIVPLKLDKPTADTNTYTYNFSEQTYVVAPSDYYTVEGATHKDAGSYTVSVKLKDKINVQWKDETTSDVTFTFNIAKLLIEKPEAVTTKYTFTGSQITYGLATNEGYTISNHQQTAAGTYEVKVALKDTNNTAWKDETTTDLTFSFVIEKLGLVKPAENKKKFVYNEENQEYTLTLHPGYVILNNNRTVAGSQEVRVVLLDKDNSYWEDDKTTDDVVYTFTIAKQQVAKPTADTTKFVFNGSFQEYALTASEFYTISGQSRQVVGSQKVSVVLKDKANYEWVGGGDTDLEFTFSIAKLEVTKPSADTTKFVYSGADQTYTVAPNANYVVINNVRRIVGSQTVVVELRDKENTCWADKTTANIEFTFEIAKKEVVKPSADTTKFVYDETNKVYNIAADPAYEVLNNNRTVTGSQTVIVRLYDKENTCWADKSTDDLSFTFSIAKHQVAKPTADTTKFVFNGSFQEYALTASEFYTISNQFRQVAGSQTVSVVLKDKANYEWVGGGDADLAFTFSIAKQEVAKPVASTKTYIYSGSNQVYELAENEAYFISNADRTIVGSQIVVVELKDKENTCWADKSNANLTFTFNIEQQKVAIPAADTTSFVYSGSAQVYSLTSSNLYTISNDVRTNAGSQTVVVDLLDKANYCWTDGTIAAKTYAFNIAKYEVAVPAANNSVFVFNGNNQVYKLAESKYYHIDNNERIASGSQYVTVSLFDTDNTCWVGGSIAVQRYEFVINKLVIAIPAANATNFIYNGDSQKYALVTSPWYEIRNDIKLQPGRQIVSVELIDKENTVWEDLTTTDKLYHFCMKQKYILKVNYCDCNCDGLTYDTPVCIIDSERGLLPEYGLEVRDIASQSAYFNALRANDLIVKSQSVHHVYNVIMVEDGAMVEPDGNVVVMMYIPEELQSKEFSVYRFVDGEITKMACSEVDENGYVTFLADQLGDFVVVDHHKCYAHWILLALLVMFVAFFCVRFLVYKKTEADLCYAIVGSVFAVALVIVATIFSVAYCIPCIVLLGVSALLLGFAALLLILKREGGIIVNSAVAWTLIAIELIIIAAIISAIILASLH